MLDSYDQREQAHHTRAQLVEDMSVSSILIYYPRRNEREVRIILHLRACPEVSSNYSGVARQLLADVIGKFEWNAGGMVRPGRLG